MKPSPTVLKDALHCDLVVDYKLQPCCFLALSYPLPQLLIWRGMTSLLHSPPWSDPSGSSAQKCVKLQDICPPPLPCPPPHPLVVVPMPLSGPKSVSSCRTSCPPT
jgi:hypothetical protein